MLMRELFESPSEEFVTKDDCVKAAKEEGKKKDGWRIGAWTLADQRGEVRVLGADDRVYIFKGGKGGRRMESMKFSQYRKKYPA